MANCAAYGREAGRLYACSDVGGFFVICVIVEAVDTIEAFNTNMHTEPSRRRR